ncbi:hypothetical protein ES703_38503 [subsurface metagenome]
MTEKKKVPHGTPAEALAKAFVIEKTKPKPTK